MIKTASVPVPRTEKIPYAAQMIDGNILEIHQDGESDTAQNNQQRDIDIERIMPGHHQRVAQVAGQRGKTRITECRNGMKSGKSQLLLQIHTHRAVNIAPDGKHACPLDRQRENKNIDQSAQQ